eukprot:jgi/Psemu1/19712/gm1.19712_g
MTIQTYQLKNADNDRFSDEGSEVNPTVDTSTANFNYINTSTMPATEFDWTNTWDIEIRFGKYPIDDPEPT